jgi:hypothetical protein
MTLNLGFFIREIQSQSSAIHNTSIQTTYKTQLKTPQYQINTPTTHLNKTPQHPDHKTALLLNTLSIPTLLLLLLFIYFT